MTSKNLFLVLIFALCLPATSQACCAENIYRLFPIGEIEGEIVFVEYSLSRYCKINLMGGPDNRMALRGIAKVVKTAGDTLEVMHHIDSIDVMDREIENKLQETYLQSIELVVKHPGYLPARPVSIIFNDTANIELNKVETDTSIALIGSYGGFFERDIMLDVISCFPKIPAEVRSYETDNLEITVLRMRCQTVHEHEAKDNEQRFKDLETAIWIEPHQWHGSAKDYYNVKPKSE